MPYIRPHASAFGLPTHNSMYTVLQYKITTLRWLEKQYCWKAKVCIITCTYWAYWVKAWVNECSLLPNVHGIWPMTFICGSRGWACCAWTIVTSNVSIRKVHPLVAYEIIQHDGVMFVYWTVQSLSLCIYLERLSCTKNPTVLVLKAVRIGGCPRTGVFPTVSMITTQPFLITRKVHTNQISHSHHSWSTGTIEPEDFTSTACPFATTDSEPRTSVFTFTWGYMTGEPVCPVGGLQSYVVSLVYCCGKIENKTQLHVYCHWHHRPDINKWNVWLCTCSQPTSYHNGIRLITCK